MTYNQHVILADAILDGVFPILNRMKYVRFVLYKVWFV